MCRSPRTHLLAGTFVHRTEERTVESRHSSEARDFRYALVLVILPCRNCLAPFLETLAAATCGSGKGVIFQIHLQLHGELHGNYVNDAVLYGGESFRLSSNGWIWRSYFSTVSKTWSGFLSMVHSEEANSSFLQHACSSCASDARTHSNVVPPAACPTCIQGRRM
jgi:hypothetical protein